MREFDVIAYALAVVFALLAAFNVPARVQWIGLAIAVLALPPLSHALDALT